MKRLSTYRRHLLTPLVYSAALLLLCEEWLWSVGGHALRGLSRWPPLAALERWIGALPPYVALVVFVLPALLLLPVKLLALMAIANGHTLTGLLVILLAKVGGAAAVARLYALTRPTLLSLPWFAHRHGQFMTLKDRWIARLLATPAWRRTGALAAALRRRRRRWSQAMRLWLVQRADARRRAGLLQPARVLRRFAARWRARRR
jgi:hypothetical protein